MREWEKPKKYYRDYNSEAVKTSEIIKINENGDSVLIDILAELEILRNRLEVAEEMVEYYKVEMAIVI